MGLTVSEEAGCSVFPFFPFWRREVFSKLEVDNYLLSEEDGFFLKFEVDNNLFTFWRREVFLKIWGAQYFTSKGVRGVLRSTCFIESYTHCKLIILVIWYLHEHPLTVTVRLAEGLQRRERMTQARTRRKTAREIRGNASIRTRISIEEGRWERRPPSGDFTSCIS